MRKKCLRSKNILNLNPMNWNKEWSSKSGHGMPCPYRDNPTTA